MKHFRYKKGQEIIAGPHAPIAEIVAIITFGHWFSDFFKGIKCCYLDRANSSPSQHFCSFRPGVNIILPMTLPVLL